jgi:hypothetical protein
MGPGGMNWIHLAQDRDQWRTLVNTVMNFLVKQNIGLFCVAEGLLASQEGLGSMELVS